MKILNTIKETKEILRAEKMAGKTIGIVPTMGYLHEGHLSLIQRARAENDIVVVSVFVNPTQFGPNEDLDKYPRDLQQDCQKAESVGADILFSPSVGQMYPEGYHTYVSVEKLGDNLCGSSRPGHFRGVATVVTKLFNISGADNAYFGQKDAQQFFLLKRMALDLNMDIKLHICPIIREKDGLALSSRNIYLTEEQRKQAIVLSLALKNAKSLIDAGERNAAAVIAEMVKTVKSSELADIEYIKAVDTETLSDTQVVGKSLIALAVRFGSTRLIDNMIIEV